MPSSARKLIYDTKLKINEFNTGGGTSHTILELVTLINTAYEIVVENLIKAAEFDKTARDSVLKLKVKHYELELENKGGYYIAKYPDNLYKRLNQYVIASCDECKGTKEIVPRIVQDDDINEAKKNPYRRSNFGWEQLIANEGPDGLYIYTDKMKAEKVIIDYYRKINYLQAPSLVECQDNIYFDYDDRLITTDVNFDLDNTYVHRKVTDVASLLNSTIIKDPEAFNQKLQEIMNIQKII